MSHWTGPLLTPMFSRWGSAERGEENRKHLEMCFWNKWWRIFCFSLWIWPLCTGKVCQLKQTPALWGQWRSMCPPTPCLLPCLESCAPGAGPGLTEGPQPHAEGERAPLYFGILGAAGRCGDNLRVGHQTTPCWLMAQPSFPSITNSSKQSWQKVKLPSLSWEMPFPFSLSTSSSPGLSGQTSCLDMPLAGYSSHAFHGTWWPAGTCGLQP